MSSTTDNTEEHNALENQNSLRRSTLPTLNKRRAARGARDSKPGLRSGLFPSWSEVAARFQFDTRHAENRQVRDSRGSSASGRFCASVFGPRRADHHEHCFESSVDQLEPHRFSRLPAGSQPRLAGLVCDRFEHRYGRTRDATDSPCTENCCGDHSPWNRSIITFHLPAAGESTATCSEASRRGREISQRAVRPPYNRTGRDPHLPVFPHAALTLAPTRVVPGTTSISYSFGSSLLNVTIGGEHTCESQVCNFTDKRCHASWNNGSRMA